MSPSENFSQNGSTSKDARSAAQQSLRPIESLSRVSSSTSLEVPQHKPFRRQSAASSIAASDISELSFGSSETINGGRSNLFRSISYTSSNVSQYTSPSLWKAKLEEFWIANYGAFMVLLSQAFGVTMNVSTRLLETTGSHGAPMHPFQILFTRMSITTLLCTVWALWTRSIPHFPLGPPGVRWLLVIRGLCGFFGVFGLYFSLVYLPMSEAVVLGFLAPILTCYACSLLIPGETFTRQQQMAGFVSLFGVVFIARPASLFTSSSTQTTAPGAGDGISQHGNSTIAGDSSQTPNQPTKSQHLFAVGIAMIGVLGGTGAMTSIRAIGTRAHAFISVNYFSAWSTIVSVSGLVLIPSVHFRLPGNLLEWGLLSILGFCGFIMQWLLTIGLAYGGPATSSDERKQSFQDDIELQSPHGDPQMAINVPARNSVISEALSPRSLPQRPHRHKRNSRTHPPVRVSGTRATSMMYTQMLFALAGDKVVWGVMPDIWSWIGSCLILGGAIWVAADNSKAKKAGKDDRNERSTDESGAGHKTTETAHEEEVGLLRDMDSDEEDSVPKSLESQNPTSSSTSGTTGGANER